MKFALSFAALAVLGILAAGQPRAQDINSNSSANSASGSQSTSGSSSRASSNGSTSGASTTSGGRQSVTLNQNSTTPSSTTGTYNSNGTQTNRDIVSGGTNSTLNTQQSGFTSSDVTVRTTPTVYAPPVSGGNPCTLAVSGGVSVIGWGAAAGGTFVDEDCATRQKIAMIHNAGYAVAARELMCNDRKTYYAFRGTPTPCNPRPEFDGTPAAGAPPPAAFPQQAPTVVTPAPMVQQGPLPGRANLPRCNPRAGITDNCFSG